MMSEIFVQVLYDFHYCSGDGEEIKMTAGEELLLIQKSNENWWQVIRSSESQPFYAPSNYLTIIGLNCKDTIDVNSNISRNDISENENILTAKNSIDVANGANTKIENLEHSKEANHALSFRNKLCKSDFASSDIFNNLQKQSSVQVFGSHKVDQDLRVLNESSQDAVSPIYVNIPISFGISPPNPKPDQIPIRKLTNEWSEYVDEGSGRKYYYHTSGKVTWKPPRRNENNQSSIVDSEPSSPKSNSSLNVPDPPPKQLKPKLKKLAHSSNESLESQSSPCMFTILPPGWSQESDSSSGAVYYLNGTTKKKWFASSDENGRTYFYDEDNSESVWELPDTSFSPTCQETKQCHVNDSFLESSEEDISQEGSNLVKSLTESPSSPKLRKKAPKLPVPRHFKTRSLVVPECVNLAGSEENKGFLPVSFGEGYWPSVEDGHFSITRKGTLNKTKLFEGGKKIRKNWTSSFVVLTDVFLLFYKDIRSAHLADPKIKPELCIDLNGALVEWCSDKSSRKNVFQISTVLGHQLLLQDDNAQTTKEWYDTIQAAIMMLPSGLEQADSRYREEKKDIKLSRSKSTKHYSPVKNDVESEVVLPPEKKRKIRDKLRQFFVRRPTQESLREKGILLDEPVFGCHLDNLCLREDRKVPKFVTKCIEVIENKELTADGLYRASGNLSQVQKIRIHVNQDDYSCLKEEEDVHVLTGALKLFFREMKEPLFPFHMFDKFMNAIALPEASSKLEALKKLIRKLPEPNFETLKTLLQHLLRVTDFHKQNRMQVQNLAIVFGPTLMWPEQVSANIALDMMHQNRIVEFLLLEFYEIFPSNSLDEKN